MLKNKSEKPAIFVVVCVFSAWTSIAVYSQLLSPGTARAKTQSYIWILYPIIPYLYTLISASARANLSSCVSDPAVMEQQHQNTSAHTHTRTHTPKRLRSFFSFPSLWQEQRADPQESAAPRVYAWGRCCCCASACGERQHHARALSRFPPVKWRRGRQTRTVRRAV